jgi:hypothetical protein
MALTNAEKQKRWRARHIRERRNARRVANLLVKKRLSEEDIDEIAAVLRQFLAREGVRRLRQALKAGAAPAQAAMRA